MEEQGADGEPAKSGKCHDTWLFDRLMLIYVICVILLSFYALMSLQ